METGIASPTSRRSPINWPQFHLANNMANPVIGPVHEFDEAPLRCACRITFWQLAFRPMHGPVSLGEKTILERSVPSIPTGRHQFGQSLQLHDHRDRAVHGLQRPGATRRPSGIVRGPSAPIARSPRFRRRPARPDNAPSTCGKSPVGSESEHHVHRHAGGSDPNGTYRNCFADGKPTVLPDFNSAYSDVNPTTASNGGMRGNCTPFIVAKYGSAGACPAGQNFVAGRGCVPLIVAALHCWC